MFYRDIVLNEVKAKYFKTTKEQENTMKLQNSMKDKDTKEKNKMKADYLRKRGFEGMTKPVDRLKAHSDKNYDKQMTSLKNRSANDLNASGRLLKRT